MPGAGAGAAAPRRGRYWPTPAQLQLLRAALLDGEPAQSAWRNWRAAVDLDRLDAGSERLLPLLIHNLKRLGVEEPDLGRYGGILQYTFVANRRRVARLTPVLRALDEAGIPAMLLKGLGLAVHHYAHLGLRPMADTDLLVPVADLARAMSILDAHGWRGTSMPPDVGLRHALQCVAADGQQLDLHWRFMWELSGDDRADAVWTRAAPGAVDGAPVRVLAADDMLLHVVVHGARWNTVPPVRWVADAVTVLTAAGASFPWGRLVESARAGGLVLPLRDALEYLAACLDVPVPAEVVFALRQHQPTRFERVEHRMRAWASPLLGGFPLEVCHHVRLTRGRGARAVLVGLPAYLRAVYGVPSLSAVPADFLRRAARRVRSSAAAD